MISRFLLRVSEVSSEREIVYFLSDSKLKPPRTSGRRCYNHSPFQIRRTKIKFTRFKFGLNLSFGKVRVPEERIRMYTEYTIPPNTNQRAPEGLHKVAGPFDIALIKLRVGVTLMPGRVVPVGQIVFPCPIFLLNAQACLSRIKDQGVSGVVQGCSHINLFSFFYSPDILLNLDFILKMQPNLERS